MKHGHCTTLLLLTYFLKIYFTKSFILIFKCKMCHKPILTSVWLNDLNISLFPYFLFYFILFYLHFLSLPKLHVKLLVFWHQGEVILKIKSFNTTFINETKYIKDCLQKFPTCIQFIQTCFRCFPL